MTGTPLKSPTGARGRARAALLGVVFAYLLWPVVQPAASVMNSDWPSYATGGTLVLHHPSSLYDRPTQAGTEQQIVGGKRLANREQGAFLSFDQGPWIAMMAAAFIAAGPDIGGRLWIELEVVAMLVGLALAATAAASKQNRGSSPDGHGEGPWSTGTLAAMASAPTALVMFNAQLDGLVILGLGLAWYLWSRSQLAAGLALTLCLAKPQLVLPVAAGLLLFQAYRAIAGWALGAAALVGAVLLAHPSWLSEWPRFIAHGAGQLGYELSLTGVALRSGLPGQWTYALAGIVFLAGLLALLGLAWRRRQCPRVVIALLVAGGFGLSPHTLAADTALLTFALLAWGKASAMDWWLVSGLALAAAVLHALPLSSLVGIGLAAVVVWRIGWAGGERGLRPVAGDPASR